MNFTWLLIIAASQSQVIQDGTTAQLAFQWGVLQREDGRAADAIASFRTAAVHLQSLPSSTSAYRAGNAWYLAGNLPRAIAAYRRGLALDPADARLRTALAYAREQVKYPPGLAHQLRPEADWWPSGLTLQVVGGYAFGLYVAGCLAVTRWRMTRRRLWLAIGVTLFGLAAVPALGSGVYWWHARRDAAMPVVVAARDEPLRVGNGVDYPATLDLPRGVELRRLFDRGGWLQVETNGGAIGWIPNESVIPVRDASEKRESDQHATPKRREPVAP